jgi:L-lactate dehydrogenase complex protein LldG
MEPSATDPTGARAAILAAIRAGNRAACPTQGGIPAPRIAFTEPLIERWQRLWTSRAGTVAALPDRAALPAAVASWCQTEQIAPPTVVSATLLDLQWPADWSLSCAPADITTQTALSEAWAGVAEVGSLVFFSAPAHPTTHRFVPDNHLVVLSAARIVDHFETLWQMLRQELGQNGPNSEDWRTHLPRTVNFVAGPSRTGDIEQTIQLGAHGPRRVHVFLIP